MAYWLNVCIGTHFCPASPFFGDGLSFCLKSVKLVSSCFVGELHSHYTVYSSAATTTVRMPRAIYVCMVFKVGLCFKHSTSYTIFYLTRLALIMDYAWETIVTQSSHEKWGVQEGGGGHDNSSMQEFQKHKQALRVSNSFARWPAKGDCRGFDGDYTEVVTCSTTFLHSSMFMWTLSQNSLPGIVHDQR